MPAEGCFLPPTLVTGLAPADTLMQEEVLGPVLVSTTFRTPAEAAHLANDTRYGLAASVWSETVALALDMVPRLAAGIVWVNGTHMFDAAAPFGGLRESGNGREGGWEGLAAYLRPAEAGRPLKPAAPFPGRGTGTDAGTDRTAKLYIGGKQTRADAGDTRPLYGRTGRIIGQAPVAGAKDIGNAVAAARAATAWPAATAHQRAQVLCDLAETLSTREAEVAQRLNTMTGGRSGRREVAASVERLFTWAAWADKHDGAARAAPVRGLTLALREPLGVIGALLPFEAPLLGLVSVLGPILAFGNRAVLVASEPFPLAATDFIQILETSDLPAGVANILTGDHADLAPALAAHLDLDAVWSFSAADVSATIERESAGNLKRTWVNDGRARDWFGPAGADRAFREAATEVKTVWIPHGA
jgi:aldehyde dehydrogenase (NAD+)